MENWVNEASISRVRLKLGFLLRHKIQHQLFLQHVSCIIFRFLIIKCLRLVLLGDSKRQSQGLAQIRVFL